jgi:hypothetical protein
MKQTNAGVPERSKGQDLRETKTKPSCGSVPSAGRIRLPAIKNEQLKEMMK